MLARSLTTRNGELAPRLNLGVVRLRVVKNPGFLLQFDVRGRGVPRHVLKVSATCELRRLT